MTGERSDLRSSRPECRPAADFALIDEVAPSSSAAWFVRRFRCGAVAVCDPQADQLMDAARTTPVPAQRYALLIQAAARIDDAQLFIPITAPVRWSLVSSAVPELRREPLRSSHAHRPGTDSRRTD